MWPPLYPEGFILPDGSIVKPWCKIDETCNTSLAANQEQCFNGLNLRCYQWGLSPAQGIFKRYQYKILPLRQTSVC